MRKPFKKLLSEVSVEEAHGGSGSRQVIFSKEDDVSKHFQAMTKGFLPPNAAYDWHHHDNIDEFWIVLKGVGTVSYKDGEGQIKTIPYKADDVFYMPAGIVHKIECSGPETSEYYFVRLDS